MHLADVTCLSASCAMIRAITLLDWSLVFAFELVTDMSTINFVQQSSQNQACVFDLLCSEPVINRGVCLSMFFFLLGM